MTAHENLIRIANEKGASLSDLSRRLGRNQAYLSQFVTRGSPRRLPEEKRRHLAIALNVDGRLRGARDPWTPSISVEGRTAS